MSVSEWTCLNTKCTYDKQPSPGQPCPVCGKEVKEFKFKEFGNILNDKLGLKKSIERTKKQEKVAGRTNFAQNAPPPKSISLSFIIPQFRNA